MEFTMIGECIQSRAGAPAVCGSRWNVLWPAPSTGDDLPRCPFRGDEVVQRKDEVSLEEEKDIDKVFELIPARGGSATKSVDDGRSHDGGREEGDSQNCWGRNRLNSRTSLGPEDVTGS